MPRCLYHKINPIRNQHQPTDSLLNMDERDDTVLDDNEVEAEELECSCVR